MNNPRYCKYFFLTGIFTSKLNFRELKQRKDKTILYHYGYCCPVLSYLLVLCNLTDLLEKDELIGCQ